MSSGSGQALGVFCPSVVSPCCLSALRLDFPLLYNQAPVFPASVELRSVDVTCEAESQNGALDCYSGAKHTDVMAMAGAIYLYTASLGRMMIILGRGGLLLKKSDGGECMLRSPTLYISLFACCRGPSAEQVFPTTGVHPGRLCSGGWQRSLALSHQGHLAKAQPVSLS